MTIKLNESLINGWTYNAAYLAKIMKRVSTPDERDHVESVNIIITSFFNHYLFYLQSNKLIYLILIKKLMISSKFWHLN